jgi:hypothetical protein
MHCATEDSYSRHRHNPVRMPGCTPAPRRHCRRSTCFLPPDPRRPDRSETLARMRFAFRPAVRYFAPQLAIPHFGSVRARVRPLGLCRPRRPANPCSAGPSRTTSAQSRGRHNADSLDRDQEIPCNSRAWSSRTCRCSSPWTSAQRQERIDERGIAVLSSATLLQGTCLQQPDASRQATSWTLLDRSRESALCRSA